MMSVTTVQAADKAWATAYCKTGTTASGTQTTENRTVAGKPEWFGKTIWLWVDDGDGKIKEENYLGRYVVEDTGSDPIKEGNVIDIYIPDKEACIQFGSKRVIYILKEGDTDGDINEFGW